MFEPGVQIFPVLLLGNLWSPLIQHPTRRQDVGVHVWLGSTLLLDHLFSSLVFPNSPCA